MDGRLDVMDVAAGLLIEARAVATDDTALRVRTGEASPLDVLLGVWTFLPVEHRMTGREALTVAEQAVERAWAAHDRNVTDTIAVFDAALEGLAASPRPARRRRRLR